MIKVFKNLFGPKRISTKELNRIDKYFEKEFVRLFITKLNREYNIDVDPFTFVDSTLNGDTLMVSVMDVNKNKIIFKGDCTYTDKQLLLYCVDKEFLKENKLNMLYYSLNIKGMRRFRK